MSDEELVEKVAEAIYADGLDDCGMTWDRLAASDEYDDADVYRATARRAITAVREHEAGLAAAVEVVAREAIGAIGTGGHSHWREGGWGGSCSACEAQEAERNRLRAALTDTGAAEALRKRDAEVLRAAADDRLSACEVSPDYASSSETRIAEWLRARADRIEADNA